MEKDWERAIHNTDGAKTLPMRRRADIGWPRPFLVLLYRGQVGQAFLPAPQRTGLEACPYLCRTRYTDWVRYKQKARRAWKQCDGLSRGAESFLPGYTRAVFSAASTRLSPSGTRRMRTPVASKMALATAAPVGLHAASPAP